MKNRKLKFPLLLVICVSLLIVACKSSEKSIEPKDKDVLESSLLWEISGNELTKPSYVYGTIHMIEADDFFWPEGTLVAVDQTEQMVFEIDMDEMTDISSQMGLLQKAFMSDGLGLKDLLSDEDYNMVKSHFEKLGLPLFLFEKMKPMFLTVFTAEGMSPEGFQSGAIKSYEMELNELAQANNMPTEGLETIEFQMAVFDSIPYQAQADMLVESIKMGDQGSMAFSKLVELYKTQDIDKMYDMTSSEESQLDDYEGVLLTGRNRAWIPKMKQFMNDKTTFFAVGAAHLGGPDGVIRLLRNEGYTLTPVLQKNHG